MRSHSGTRQLIYGPTAICRIDPMRYPTLMFSTWCRLNLFWDDIYRHGDEQLLQLLTKLCERIWDQEAVPEDFKDARIVHTFKRNGDRVWCDDHRRISLLFIADKIIARCPQPTIVTRPAQRGNSARESMRLLSWPGYVRHDLCCYPISHRLHTGACVNLVLLTYLLTSDYLRQIKKSAANKTGISTWSNQGLRLCSQGRSLERSK